MCGVTARRTPRAAKRPPVIAAPERIEVPNIVADADLVGEVVQMLKAIQLRRVRLQVQQTAWGAAGDAIVNTETGWTFDQTLAALDAEEQRLAAAYPDIIARIQIIREEPAT